MKEISIAEIIDCIKSEVINIFGNYKNAYIKYLRPRELVDEYTLDWVSGSIVNKQQIIEQSPSKVFLCDATVIYSDLMKKQKKVLIHVKNPKLAIAMIGNRYFVQKPFPQIHPTAVIHHEAEIGQNVFIGANVTIGKCRIGNNCYIYPNVTIYDRSTIGDFVVIHSGAVICTDGLGCIRTENGRLYEFPQLGGVVIENNVYIGSNTNIVSGSLSDTIIGEGSKINGICFIGSNCNIGKNVWITGSTMLAGSVKVGNNATIYSKVVVREHLIIGSNTVIGMGSVVTKNVPEGETWVGNPAKKFFRG